MPQKLHLNSRWLTILAGIFAIIVLIKVGFDYWPEIKLLMHPTHEHRVMLTKMIRDHGAKDFLLLMVVIALLNAIPGMSIAAVCILAGVCYGPWIGLLISWSGNRESGSCLAVQPRTPVTKSQEASTAAKTAQSASSPPRPGYWLYDSSHSQCSGQLLGSPAQGLTDTDAALDCPGNAAMLIYLRVWRQCNF